VKSPNELVVRECDSEYSAAPVNESVSRVNFTWFLEVCLNYQSAHCAIQYECKA